MCIRDSLGDVRGKVNVFQLGVIVFTVGSLLCGLSASLEVLILARIDVYKRQTRIVPRRAIVPPRLRRPISASIDETSLK